MEWTLTVGLCAVSFSLHATSQLTRLVITEGSLLIVEPRELAQMEHKLAPSAEFAIKDYLGKRTFV